MSVSKAAITLLTARCRFGNDRGMEKHALTSFRETEQLSKSNLAKRLKCSPAAVTRWEAGERQIGAKWLQKIAAELGIPAAKLRPDLAELLREEAQ